MKYLESRHLFVSKYEFSCVSVRSESFPCALGRLNQPLQLPVPCLVLSMLRSQDLLNSQIFCFLCQDVIKSLFQ